jgi:hypothetical protein
MSMKIPVFGSGMPNLGGLFSSSTGSLYLITLDIYIWLFAPGFKVGQIYEKDGKRLKIEQVVEDHIENQLLVYARDVTDTTSPGVQEAGWQWIALGVAVLAGLGIGAYALRKVELIIENPAGQAVLIGGVAVLILMLALGLTVVLKKFKKK